MKQLKLSQWLLTGCVFSVACGTESPTGTDSLTEGPLAMSEGMGMDPADGTNAQSAVEMPMEPGAVGDVPGESVGGMASAADGMPSAADGMPSAADGMPGAAQPPAGDGPVGEAAPGAAMPGEGQPPAPVPDPVVDMPGEGEPTMPEPPVINDPPAVPDNRPNVIYVMPDDVSHNAISYYNPTGPVKTPNLDKLAGDSVRLDDFHVSPTCAPTRAALMTGRYSNATGVWHTIRGRATMRQEEITMADVFKANGYATALFFKWHLGDNYPFRPEDKGFEHVAWLPGGGTGQIADFWGNTNDSATAHINGELVEMVDEDDGIEGAFTTNFFFNRAMEFMDENIQKGKPFFAYIPTGTAHNPQVMPPDARRGLSAAQATMENIDKNMGNLMEFLDDRGIAKNTILIYSTDNGPLDEFEKGRTKIQLKGTKGSHFDGGTRVPCFVRWEGGGVGGPGQGRDAKALTAHIDWLPTFMDMLGFDDVPDRPAHLAMHGQSFKNFLDADASNDPGAEFKARAVTVDNMRTDNLQKFKSLSVKMDVWDGDTINRKWRLMRDSANGAWRLYDALTDPGQNNNLINNQAHAGVVSKLQQEYEAYWNIVSAPGNDYTRIILGHEDEPVTKLAGQDFINSNCWNHGQVAGGACKPGTITVEFSKQGTYHFDLRRWPKEAAGESNLTTAPRAPVYAGVRTVAIPVAGAGIRISNGNQVYVNEQKDAVAGADGIEFTVADIPAGPASIETWFYNQAGERFSAVYYNYVQHQAE